MVEVLRERHDTDIAEHGKKKQAAGMLKVSESVLGNWPKRGLPFSRVIEIAKILDVDVYYLLCIAEHKGRFGNPASSGLQDQMAADLAKLQRQLKT